MRSTIVLGLVAMAAAAAASAEDYPLTFKTIPAKDVMAFPGGYGIYGQLRLAKPARLNKEPKAISRHPLYGECGSETPARAGFLFRLDESKGDGKGYDQLIVDMNRNGDLTDDAVAPLVVQPADRRTPSPAMRPKLFGPIEAPAGKLIAGGRPICFAQAYISDISSLLRSGQTVPDLYAGQLSLKAGWFLEATVDLNGLKQKVGLFDRHV